MVKTARNIIICVLLLSCDGTQDTEDTDAMAPTPTGEVYICHSPGDTEHGRACSDRCLENKGSYCWLLSKESCEGDHQYQWQRENCHFFD